MFIQSLTFLRDCKFTKAGTTSMWITTIFPMPISCTEWVFIKVSVERVNFSTSWWQIPSATVPCNKLGKQWAIVPRTIWINYNITLKTKVLNIKPYKCSTFISHHISLAIYYLMTPFFQFFACTVDPSTTAGVCRGYFLCSKRNPHTHLVSVLHSPSLGWILHLLLQAFNFPPDCVLHETGTTCPCGLCCIWMPSTT